jgi:isoleucyl-tRNA synthetase
VFERGWPTAPAAWAAPELEGPLERVLELRARVNRLLESSRGRGELGASLEAQVQLELGEGEAARTLRAALALLEGSAQPRIDNLPDWLLVSALRIGGASPADPLAESSEGGVTVRIARAEGVKCERCWHVEPDIGAHASHPSLCGRCVAVLEAPAGPEG